MVDQQSVDVLIMGGENVLLQHVGFKLGQKFLHEEQD
jgi:hypothetical protein